MPGLERALERMAGSDKSVSTCQASLRELQGAAGGRPGVQADALLHRDSYCSNDTLLKQLRVHNQITVQVQDEAQAGPTNAPFRPLALPPTVDHVVLQQNVFDFSEKI
jgi:hypothetical protein